VPSRNRLSIDSLANLLSIMLLNPLKKDSGAAKKGSQVSDRPTERDMGSGEELGGSMSEAPILDDHMLVQAAELDRQPGELFDSEDFLRFSGLIDFNIEFPSVQMHISGERLPTDIRGERMMQGIRSRQFGTQQ